MGGEMPVAATYINELSRAHGRGRFFMAYELIFPFGLFMAAVSGCAACTDLRLAGAVRARHDPGIHHHGADSAPARIAALADRPGPAQRGGCDHPADRSEHGQAHSGSAVAPAAAQKKKERLARAVLAGLSPAHADRVGDLGDDLRRHQRDEQLDADDLHDGLRPSASDGAESRSSYEWDADSRADPLHLRHRHRGAPSLDDGVLHHRRIAAACRWEYSAPATWSRSRSSRR